ncbi:MAG: outer membrane protein assembly factor BamE [Deltaproteobacteria bacterium]|nr:outer membrane protein assembly factor BamE [Deltaproteobacteria bacterium]
MLKSYIRKKTLFAGFLVIIIFFCIPVAAEQKDEIIVLKQKISELERRINDLENLLKIFQEPGKIQPGTESGWQNKKNWRKLETGMTQSEVEAILGEPIKTIKGVRTFWYYPNIYCGYVSFDEEGRLIRWNEP